MQENQTPIPAKKHSSPDFELITQDEHNKIYFVASDKDPAPAPTNTPPSAGINPMSTTSTTLTWL